MNHFVKLSELNPLQTKQYNRAIEAAFPSIISQSPIIKKYWNQLERYFPKHQLLLINQNEEIIGFINTVPFHFKQNLNNLPNTGWDWMLSKGISDFENKIEPNYLGGLQVIVRSKFQNLGFSKQILEEAKKLRRESKLQKLVIPIRPTKKHLFPNLSMKEYMEIKEKNEIFDPWIRTHLKSGAQIIKICEKSMTISGDLKFWESIFNKKINTSGEHVLDKALMPIKIDLNKDYGEYTEPNIWIFYS